MTEPRQEDSLRQPGTALLQPRPVTPDVWGMIKEQSAVLEAAGKGTQILPRGITNRYQIAAILQKGAELGFGSMYSLENIVLIEGSPAVSGQAIANLLLRTHGPKSYKILEWTDELCKIRFQRADEDAGDALELTWTMKDAVRAGLAKKDNWTKYPRDMLFWRTIAQGAKARFADVISGAYTADELNVPVTITQTGDMVIDHESMSAPSAIAFESGDYEEAVADGSAMADARTVDENTGEVIEERISAVTDLRERTRGTMRGEDWAPMLDTEEQAEPKEPGPVESPSTGRSQVMREGEQAPQSRYSDEKTEAARQAYPEATERANRERERAQQEADASRQRSEAKPISNNDIATITKLCKVLGVDIPDDIADWSSERGKAHVKELATQYNQRKQKSA